MKYVNAELEIVMFNTEDIITTSAPDPDNDYDFVTDD